MSITAILLCALLGADLSGVWVLEEELPAGPRRSRLELQQKGDQLRGALVDDGPLGGVSRIEGGVKGARVRFDAVAEVDGIQLVRIYDAQLGDDGALRGTGRARGMNRWKFTARRE